jgi:hypothetical protein
MTVRKMSGKKISYYEVEFENRVYRVSITERDNPDSIYETTVELDLTGRERSEVIKLALAEHEKEDTKNG